MIQRPFERALQPTFPFIFLRAITWCGSSDLQLALPPDHVFDLRSGHHIFGDGFASKIFIDPNSLTDPTLNPNINVFNYTTTASGQTGNLLIENLHIEGVNKADNVTNGNGIFIDKSNYDVMHPDDVIERVTIRNCFFFKFGYSQTLPPINVGCAILFYHGCRNILIDGNYIDDGQGSGDATDIKLSYSTGYAIIINNRCYSTNSSNSQAIYVNVPNQSLGKLIIAGNICKDKSREGIQTMYGTGTYLDTLVVNNICFNCGWMGISNQGNAGSGGTISFIGNIVEYCGGNSPVSPPDPLPNVGLNAGIFASCTQSILIANNYVRKSGYKWTGSGPVARLHADLTTGIFVEPGSAETVIDGNIVEQSGWAGIRTSSVGGGLTIKNNTVLDNESDQIYINGTATTAIIEITNNKIQLVTKNTDGIRFQGVYGNPKVVIRSNSLMGLRQPPNPSDPNIAINLSPNPVTGDHTTGVIQGNLIDNWDQAIYLDATEASTLVPVALLIANNVLSNNVQGVVYYSLPYNGKNYGFIFQNLFDSTPGDLPNPGAFGLKHAMCATPNSGTGQLVNRLVFFDSASPGSNDPTSSAKWSPGTIILNTGPTAGGYIGWVYVNDTDRWKQFGAIVP